MRYTNFGKSQISRLGFGVMRLPTVTEGGVTRIDEEESIRILRRAMELGVNYFDTAPYYCDKMSENVLGKAVKGRRGEVFISTKNPIETNSGDDYERRLETSLKKLDTDYIDFYHFWGISLETFINSIDIPDGPMARAKRLKEQGVIRHISFSFHDAPGNLSEIIKRADGALETVLCQYNLMDRSLEQDIAFAKEQGLDVAAMGPVGGGRLGQPSKAILDLLPGLSSSAEAALRFVFNNPNVDMALSGMGSIEMLEENAALASNIAPLTDAELKRVETMMEQNKNLAGLYCTGCKYCLPCPQNVNIPEVFTLMNYHRVYGITDYARGEYKQIGKVNWRNYQNAAACVDCGLCEPKCPQKIQIRKQLKQTHEVLGV
ncbi:MAG: aldo/keto reductase [Oscillospiraceae bacterium]|nr:aldo/keto reductase [Oscillospiraceae bacterium]